MHVIYRFINYTLPTNKYSQKIIYTQNVDNIAQYVIWGRIKYYMRDSSSSILKEKLLSNTQWPKTLIYILNETKI